MDPLANDINGGWNTDPLPSGPSAHPPGSTHAPSAAAPVVPVSGPSSPNSASTLARGSSIQSTTKTNTIIRDPQVYGDPGTSLMHPPDSPDTAASSSDRGRPPPYLRVRIGGLERNRKDLLIRFDASTNLPNFRTTLYRNMQRSYVEFQRFAEQAQLCSPQTIVPALPLPHTSAATDEEDDRLVRISLQRWFSRICDDPVLQQDDELRSFIESDFGYQPVVPQAVRLRKQQQTAATQALAAMSKFVRRGTHDEDDEIQSARMALEKLEPAWASAAVAVEKMGKARKALAAATSDVGSRFISIATDENDYGLATAERKLGRTYEQLSGMSGAQIASENVVLADSLAYQSTNAHVGRDALTQRLQILEDAQNASKVAISKRRNVERLKSSSSINPSKVDDAISEMDDANELERRLNTDLDNISSNLHTALRVHSRNAHEDIAVALLEHARMSIIFNRQVLREMEALKPDLQRIGQPAAAIAAHGGSVNAPRVTSPLAGGGSQGSTPTMPAFGNGISNPSQVPSALPGQRGVPGGTAGASQSMFLPGPQGDGIQRPQSTNHRPPPSGPPIAASGNSAPPTPAPNSSPRPAVDPLTGAPLSASRPGTPVMAQSMMAPGAHGARTPVHQRRRLDERKAAKLLAGGF